MGSHVAGFEVTISCLMICHQIKYLTQLSIPTHAQLQRHRLKFIKNHLKTPTCFGLRPSSGSYNVLAKITMLSVVMWQHVVLFVSG